MRNAAGNFRFLPPVANGLKTISGCSDGKNIIERGLEELPPRNFLKFCLKSQTVSWANKEGVRFSPHNEHVSRIFPSSLLALFFFSLSHDERKRLHLLLKAFRAL